MSNVLTLGSCLGNKHIQQLKDAYAQLGKHVTSGAAFKEAEYCDAQAESKPVLHDGVLLLKNSFIF